MRKTLILLLMATVCSRMQAQQKDSIDTSLFAAGYDCYVHTTDKDGMAVTDSLKMVVYVGNKVTKTIGYYTDVVERCGEERASFSGKRRERCAHVPAVFVWREEKQMTVYDEVPPHRYEYTEPSAMIWTLNEDTMTVSGYLCHHALTTYGGRTWTAWYTEDVPSSAGPWKLGGTPGLIVKAEADGGIISFTLFELLQESRPITRFNGEGGSYSGREVKAERDRVSTSRRF